MATGGNSNALPSPPKEDGAHVTAMEERKTETGALSRKVSIKAPPPLPVKEWNTPTAVGNQYFFEDEIFRIDRKGHVRFGVVTGTTDSFSADEEEDYDELLSQGEVRVSWYPDGKDGIVQEKLLGLADRTLMPGDVVRRLVPGRDTQRGYCREINMRADVRVLGSKYVIKNVMAERLRPLAYWHRDSAVCLDSWVGSTKNIEEKAVLKSISGSRIEISSVDFYAFKDANTRHCGGIFNPEVFFPGNVIVGCVPSMDNVKLLTPKNPLYTNKKGKPVTGKYTVETVYVDAVWVNWQCKALSEEGNIRNSIEQPTPCVTGEELDRLKRLNLFEHCTLQMSDRNYLKYSKYDTVVKKSQWDREQAEKFKIILNQQQKFFGSIAHMIDSPPINSKKKCFQIDADKKSSKAKKCLLTVGKYDNSPPMRERKDSTDSSWVSDDDDLGTFDFEDMLYNEHGISDSTTMSISSSPSANSNAKTSPNRHQDNKKNIANKSLKKIKTVRQPNEFVPKDGNEIVTEALLVYSTATVVWQDGTVEYNIPSTQLYPIHHLDNHEFFPGDFVISAKDDSDVSFRDYGVIQVVDHHGRTALVKWFTTYTSADEPRPAYKGESEVSVYDLKDHPDFQCRPGTMVIRVANFVGEDASCTAGQVIDNYIDGRVKVWWVDGHISMCWPQDLFEVGQYDHADLDADSDDSWETESENSEVGVACTPKLSIAESNVLSNIERARVYIARLEELFTISPTAQSPEVTNKLLSVYKGCRFFDRLLNTSFFHEDNFMGLIERVRTCGAQTMSERALDRKNRLFSDPSQPIPMPSMRLHLVSQPKDNPPIAQQQTPCRYQAIVSVNGSQKLPNSATLITNSTKSVSVYASTSSASKEFAPKVLFNITSTPFKSAGNISSSVAEELGSALCAIAGKRKCSDLTANDVINDKSGEKPTSLYNLLTTTPIVPNTSNATLASSMLTVNSTPSGEEVAVSPNKNNSYNYEKNQLLTSAILNIEKAFEKTSHLHAGNTAATSSQDDSGNFSRNENCDGSSTSYASSPDLTNMDANNSSLVKVIDDPKSISCTSIDFTENGPSDHACMRLCSLLKQQLLKCIDEIREKYYQDGDLNTNEVFSLDGDSEISETIIELKDETIAKHDTEKEMAVKEALSLIAEKVMEKIGADDEEELATTGPSSTKHEKITPPASPANNLVAVTSSFAFTENFKVLPNAPRSHTFYVNAFHPYQANVYYRAVQREHHMLKNSLPPGVSVRVFEDRMDLLTAMIEGPKKTPYENGLFFFDIQLGREYPRSPPLCHYISYCSDRLNPNLYEDGKVCVSLLGTWSGRDTEVWGSNSTLLQVIVSIQGLILVSEPYFNEAGYEKQKGTPQGAENSPLYNEMVIIKMVQATTKMLQQPPRMFYDEVLDYYAHNGQSMYERIRDWLELSKRYLNAEEQRRAASPSTLMEAKGYVPPDFPLVPGSRGFCLTLEGQLEIFQLQLKKLSTANSTISPAAIAQKE